MSKALLIICLATTLFVRRSGAQTAADRGQIPPGPLIVAAMPDMSAWTIDYTYTAESTPDSAKAKMAGFMQTAEKDPALARSMKNSNFLYALMAPRPKHVAITKTGNVRHEQTDLELNYKDEFWFFSESLVERRPYSSDLLAAPTDMKAKDFPEFDWIDKENYTGLKKFGPVDCLTFQQAVDPNAILNPRMYAQMHGVGAAAPDQRVSTTAYVDLITRYPVALVFGKEPRHYTILAPPTSVLVVPADIAAAAAAAKARLEAATKPLSPP